MGVSPIDQGYWSLLSSLEQGSSHPGNTSAHQSAHDSSGPGSTEHVRGKARGPLLLRVLVALSVADHVGKVQGQSDSDDQQPLELERQDAKNAKDDPDSGSDIESCPEKARVDGVERAAWLYIRREIFDELGSLPLSYLSPLTVHS